jgi:transposase
MLPTGMRILVCTAPQDMRRSFDKLAQVARELLGEEPQSGALYVFVGRSATRVKVLWWDRNGYCILYKRLHRALFLIPTEAATVGSAMQIDAEALAALLAGVEKKSREDKRELH